MMTEPPTISAYDWTCSMCGANIKAGDSHQCPVSDYSGTRLLWEIRGILLRIEDKLDLLGEDND